MNKEGAISAMLIGLATTFSYIVYFKFLGGSTDQWLFGVSPEGIGFVFMWLALGTGICVALFTAPPPQEVQDLVEDIRVPQKMNNSVDDIEAASTGSYSQGR